MTTESIVELGRQALLTMLLVSGPMLAAGLLVGLLISIFQAATQINEMTMTFVPKILAVMATMILLLPWIIANLTRFTTSVFERLTLLGVS